MYYNAAAHLRRAHFCPRKRGRKARGEERESRAGKAGGDWPPIEWLKANGWLREIEVSSQDAFGSQEGEEAGLPASGAETVPSQDLAGEETLALQSYPPTTDFTYGYPTPIEVGTTFWPVDQCLSATQAMPTIDAMYGVGVLPEGYVY